MLQKCEQVTAMAADVMTPVPPSERGFSDPNHVIIISVPLTVRLVLTLYKLIVRYVLNHSIYTINIYSTKMECISIVSDYS